MDSFARSPRESRRPVLEVVEEVIGVTDIRRKRVRLGPKCPAGREVSAREAIGPVTRLTMKNAVAARTVTATATPKVVVSICHQRLFRVRSDGAGGGP
jgi:hypothetical protein